MDIVSTLGLIVTVVSTIACPIIASNKGRSAFGWFLGGLFFGGLALIIVSCLSSKNTNKNN